MTHTEEKALRICGPKTRKVAAGREKFIIRSLRICNIHKILLV